MMKINFTAFLALLSAVMQINAMEPPAKRIKLYGSEQPEIAEQSVGPMREVDEVIFRNFDIPEEDANVFDLSKDTALPEMLKFLACATDNSIKLKLLDKVQYEEDLDYFQKYVSKIVSDLESLEEKIISISIDSSPIKNEREDVYYPLMCPKGVKQLAKSKIANKVKALEWVMILDEEHAPYLRLFRNLEKLVIADLQVHNLGFLKGLDKLEKLSLTIDCSNIERVLNLEVLGLLPFLKKLEIYGSGFSYEEVREMLEKSEFFYKKNQGFLDCDGVA